MTTLVQLNKGSADRPALIFVHGLGGHPIDTWRHATTKAEDCWPHWVGQDTGCDVWSLGYDAELSAWRDQAMPLPDQGDQVLDRLAALPALSGRQLLLIGHSMGGLVIKTVLVSGRTKGDTRYGGLVKRICGVVFVATPHNGAQLANVAKAVRLVLRPNDQLFDLALHEAHLRTLNQQFRHAVAEQAIQARVFGERRGLLIGKRIFGFHVGPHVLVVDPSSSDPGLPDVTAVPLAEDHFSICKPADKSQQIHGSLCEFVNTLTAAMAPVPPVVLSPPPSSAATASIASLIHATKPERDGRIKGADDNRLLPRERAVLGRETEIAQVLEFLRGQRTATVVTALVAGVGGIGKTEVCKAALKRWLLERPDAVVYYVDVPDRAGVPMLIDRLGRALGLASADTFAQVQAALQPGVYYLDNLESVVELPEGQAVLRQLAQQPGVRILASSRVSLPTLFGALIAIDVLAEHPALQLFRELWSGTDALPGDEELRRFVVDQLGAHALSVTLVARLGECYAYADLVKRWQAKGADVAQDTVDQSRFGSLPASLSLTALALAPRQGALELWVVIALFPSGVDDDLLRTLEEEGGWAQARTWLVRHHLIARRGDRWLMLPPVSRYALDASLLDKDGFSWRGSREPAAGVFLSAARKAGQIASTAEALAARAWVLRHFSALDRLIRHECATSELNVNWLIAMDQALRNTYQFQTSLSAALLPTLASALPRPAGALFTAGTLEMRLGRPDEARGLYDRALVLFEKEQSGLGQADTLKALGDLERRLGRPDEARGLYDRALVLYEKVQDGLGQANTLQALGDLERRLGRPDEARGLYDRALVLYEKEQDGLGQANTLLALGDLESRLGRPDEA